ncbi:MAG TPA: sulfurtransferase TusA family protein [Longimicrobiales bacterium]|nr:sulfurtransferase TusA family protein [Longimicrobiales bacterium]
MADYNVDQTLDAAGLLCPMPVVKAAKVIRGMDPGQVLKIIATDRGAIADFPAWADDTGNELLEWKEENGSLVFYIKKGEED